MAELPIDLPIEDVTKALKDVAYVAIGFGVLTAQKVQVQRREVTQQLTDLPDQISAQINEARDNFDKVAADATAQVEKLSETLDDRIRLVEERLGDLEDRIETVLDTFEAKLPDQAAELVAQARDAAREARGQVRSLIGFAA